MSFTFVTVATGEPSVTYYESVAPILEQHCVVCHRPDAVAPMSLMNYKQVRPWAKSVAAQVARRTMPPFHADGPIGRYENDLRLTEEQIAAVVNWVDQGAQRGDPNAFSPSRHWTSDIWPAGTPDLIVQFPRFDLSPGKVDPYVYLFSDFVPSEDVWIRGFDWNFRETKYVHHAISYQLPVGIWPKGDRLDPRKTGVPSMPGGGGAADFLPGAGPRFFSGNAIHRIRAGGQFYGVFHYSPVEQTGHWDQPQLGFYLADGEYDSVTRRLDLVTMDISIGPGVSDYRKHVRKSFKTDALVWDFHVHMHNRGRTATVNFYYPDGRVETVFNMPRFSFDWQRRYYLKQPLKVPKGTVAEFIGVWDNSSDNPANPDSTVQVSYGMGTQDEMGNANLTYTALKPTTRPIRIKAGRNVDIAAPEPEQTASIVAAIEAMSIDELKFLLARLEPEKHQFAISTWERANGKFTAQ